MNYKFLLLILFISLSSHLCSAQKLYIWCPEPHEVKAHTGFMSGQDINLVVFDGRTIPSNSRIKCESDSVQRALAKYIQAVYPSCHINVLSDSDYYKPSVQGKVTIKIGIGAYQAGFGTDINVGIGSVGGKFSYGVFPQGKWNGLVSYYVQVFDNRKEPSKKVSKEISEITSKSNLWGYKTAKDCLYESYNKANSELTNFIEDTLME
jgi:hypothetical protein